MDDIFLRNVANAVPNCIKVFVHIDVVGHYLAMGRLPIPTDGVYKGRFTTATLADHDDKFAWLEDEGDVL